jgi:FG-GAP-like repeat
VVRWFLPPIAVLAVFVPAAQSAAVTPHFGVPTIVATAVAVGGATEQETGDVNADGIADLVVTRLAFPSYETFPIGVFLGDGRGGFRDGSSLFTGPIPRTQHGRQIVIADFNGDRRNDIFVADHGYDAEPFPGYPNTLALSTPEGRLVDASGNMPAESGFSHSAAAADVDRDGDVDIYVGNLYGGDQTPAEILLNSGTGHFTRGVGLLPPLFEEFNRNRYARALFVDANGDGTQDLVLGAENNTLSSAVLLNDGTGHFRSVPNALPPKAFGPRSITIALGALDFNRDGRVDLIAGFQREDFSGRRLQVLVGNGDGTFRDETAARLPVQSEGTAWPYAIRVADLNGDGRADFGVALGQGGAERPALYVDDGTEVFRMSVLGDTGAIFSFVDADRDRHPDILSSYAGGTVGTERHALQLQLALPARPSRFVAASTQRGSIRLTWGRVSGADRYEVWRASKGSVRKRISVTTNARFEDRRVRPRVLYRYWVRAVNAVGPSAFSAQQSARRS